MSESLIIINNEKIFKDTSGFYCDNLDLKVLPEGLNNYHKVKYIVRSSKKKGGQKINLQDIEASSNIFQFIYAVFKTFKIPNANYLIVCITPYTFLASIILFLFRKKSFVYLFSSGHEEYKYILGSWAVWIYHFMYTIATSYSQVIVCHERLHNKKKSHLVSISRLDDAWLQKCNEALLDKVRFLYVGRMSKEKGIYEFLEMFDKIKFIAEFSIVGNSEGQTILNKNVKLLGYISDQQTLIRIYDNHNIMILPSYTEATPYVLDEALSRKRPVIIFEDIEYVMKDRKGVFVSKRDIDSFTQTTNYIIQNYKEIQKNMEKNKLPTKKDMLKQISDIIKS